MSDTMTEEQVERVQIEAVFYLDDELHTSHPEFLDEWDGIVRWWYDGVPEYAGSDFGPEYEDREFRTAILCEIYGSGEPPEGWERIRSYPSSGETECPACTGEETVANTDYRGDPDCVLCEGSGYVYLGDGWAEVVFARKIVSEEEAEALEAAQNARRASNGASFDLVPVYLPGASTLGYGQGWARPGFWIEFKEGENTRSGVVLGRINRGKCAGQLVALAIGLMDLRCGMERFVHPTDVVNCYKPPSPEYLRLLALLSTPAFIIEHGARLLRDTHAGYISESSVDSQWAGGPDNDRREFYKQPVSSRRRDRQEWEKPMTNEEARGILEKHGLPLPPGGTAIINLQYNTRSTSWYAEIEEGWFWYDFREKTWVHLPLGPLTSYGAY